MELFIVEMARYVIILLFALYTFYSFRAFAGHNKQRQNRVVDEHNLDHGK